MHLVYLRARLAENRSPRQRLSIGGEWRTVGQDRKVWTVAPVWSRPRSAGQSTRSACQANSSPPGVVGQHSRSRARGPGNTAASDAPQATGPAVWKPGAAPRQAAAGPTIDAQLQRGALMASGGECAHGPAAHAQAAAAHAAMAGAVTSQRSNRRVAAADVASGHATDGQPANGQTAASLADGRYAAVSHASADHVAHADGCYAGSPKADNAAYAAGRQVQREQRGTAPGGCARAWTHERKALLSMSMHAPLVCTRSSCGGGDCSGGGLAAAMATAAGSSEPCAASAIALPRSGSVYWRCHTRRKPHGCATGAGRTISGVGSDCGPLGRAALAHHSALGGALAPWRRRRFMLLRPLLLLPLLAAAVLLCCGPAAGMHQSHQERGGGAQGGIRTIAVIGERHSGTNAMRRLLEENLDTEAVKVTNAFCANKHKYQMPNMRECLPKDETVVVVMIRNPYDWAMAMHRACWCEPDQSPTSPPLLGPDAPFEDFVTAPFMDNGVKAWVPFERQRQPCANVLECRRFKLINFLNISNWAPFVEYVRHEDVIVPEDGVEWLAGFISRHQLLVRESGRGKLKPNVHYKGKYGDTFDHTALMASSPWFNRSLVQHNETMRAAVAVVTRTMDIAVESMVGYPAIRIRP